MKVGMLTGLWHIAEGATLLESLPRVARLGFRYVDLHGVFHAGGTVVERIGRCRAPGVGRQIELGADEEDRVGRHAVRLPEAIRGDV